MDGNKPSCGEAKFGIFSAPVLIRRVFLFCALACTLHVAPELQEYCREWRYLDDIAMRAGNSRNPIEIAENLQALVAKRVRPTVDGRFYHVDHRPRLRHRAWQTWESGEGQCGEFARLLVVLLEHRGVPATRLVLSNSETEFYHTAVAYKAGGEWWLLDTRGSSPPGFYTWSRQNREPLRNLLRLDLHVNGALRVRKANPYFTRYSHLPWPRIFGETIEVNQFAAPPECASRLLEEPSLLSSTLKIAFWGVASVTISFMILLVTLISRIRAVVAFPRVLAN